MSNSSQKILGIIHLYSGVYYNIIFWAFRGRKNGIFLNVCIFSLSLFQEKNYYKVNLYI